MGLRRKRQNNGVMWMNVILLLKSAIQKQKDVLQLQESEYVGFFYIYNYEILYSLLSLLQILRNIF